jgi:hypothetical protein
MASSCHDPASPRQRERAQSKLRSIHVENPTHKGASKMDDKERSNQPWGNEDEQREKGEEKGGFDGGKEGGFGKGASEDEYSGDKGGFGAKSHVKDDYSGQEKGGEAKEFGDDAYVGGKADYGGDKGGAE